MSISGEILNNENMVCFICIDESTPPIQSGCGCLGETGWVHIDCILKVAKHAPENGDDSVWYKCKICTRKFTGNVREALAREWVSKTQEKPENDKEKMCAKLNLSNTFFERRLFKEAYKISYDLFSMQTRVLGFDNMHTLVTQMNIARILFEQDNFDLGMDMMTKVFKIQKKKQGAKNVYTLMTENEIKCRMAALKFEQGNYEEAAKIQKRLVQITDLLFGDDNVESYKNEIIRGLCLFRHGKREEAQQIQQKVLGRQQCVLGCTHTDTKNSLYLLQLYLNNSDYLMNVSINFRQ